MAFFICNGFVFRSHLTIGLFCFLIRPDELHHSMYKGGFVPSSLDFLFDYPTIGMFEFVATFFVACMCELVSMEPMERRKFPPREYSAASTMNNVSGGLCHNVSDPVETVGMQKGHETTS